MKNVLFLICLSAFLLTACGGSTASSETIEDAPLATVPAEYEGVSNPFGPEAAAAGADLFQSNCATCHGPQGHGDGPAGQSLVPPPGNLAELQTRVGDDYLYWRTREGKPGTAMLAWKGILSDEQIWQAVSFIRTLR